MRIFSTLYAKVMVWSRHRNASYFLSGMSFIESIFWPIPVDVMLAPMAMAKPNKAVYFATLATITSVLGAVVGYYLGASLYDPVVVPLIESLHATDKMKIAEAWFVEYGVWVVFIAGFSPIPYKVFTLTAGVLGMAFFPFIIASIIGRGARFFLVALLMAKGGEKMEKKLHQYVEYLGWGVVVLGAALYVILR